MYFYRLFNNSMNPQFYLFLFILNWKLFAAGHLCTQTLKIQVFYTRLKWWYYGLVHRTSWLHRPIGLWAILPPCWLSLKLTFKRKIDTKIRKLTHTHENYLCRRVKISVKYSHMQITLSKLWYVTANRISHEGSVTARRYFNAI